MNARLLASDMPHAHDRDGRPAVSQHNTDRIRTTHIGSLPRPHALLDLMKAKLNRQPYDETAYQTTLSKAVAEGVRRQVDCGIDVVTDGEFSKPGFFTYIKERLEGFEARPNQKMLLFQKEVAAFPTITPNISSRR
jgi:5-methyltetrahydropteroyltriglutamate--homocysteine methyltransferase